MKRFISILAATLVCLTAFAQEKITWTHHSELQKDNEYRVIFTGKIAKGYHTYTLTDEFSATEFMDMEVEGGELVGKPYEIGKPKQEMEDGELVEHYYDEIIIAQNVRLTAPEAKFTGTILSNVCTGGACSANWYDFTVTVLPENAVMTIIDEVEETEPIKTKPVPDAPAVETLTVEATVVEKTASETPVEVEAEEQAVVETQVEKATGIGSKVTKVQALLSNPKAKLNAEQQAGSLWGQILEAILWGFIMLLTPCVFPMVPMTVSFFLKGSDNVAAGRFKAAMYGVFIVLIYTVPIAILLLITQFFGGDAVTNNIFNWLATHWIPNIIFFIIFMVFAASFFGAFEIKLPQSLVNKSDQNSDKKGLAGVFFMALTLVLVSFSCTGPIVGNVLIQATTSGGSFIGPILVMLAFSTAFAIPFTIFAFSPTLLKKFKKSGGGWLNSVKIVIGFVEVALGLKFLSVADQTYHWGILDREVYLAIWIVVFTLLGLYLLGKIRFANDEPVEHISTTRLGLSIAVFAFVVYMIPGMWGAPLKALSGYLPPIQTHDFIVKHVRLDGEVEIVKDFEEGLEIAEKENKPIFIDVTGIACVNCREMESRVWSDPEVKVLMSKYVVVALTVDDRERLPESKWIQDVETGEYYDRVGEACNYIASTLYNTQTQPTYVLLKPNGEILLNESRNYDLDVPAFAKFLNDGLEKFEKLEEQPAESSDSSKD